jgi:hypothetical protein|tara:strand:- start:216 stop:446 length:231 start_codon:yes stop_codon:yes gene_type:complete
MEKNQNLINGAYIDKYGVKTSKKLEQIKKVAWEWVNDGGCWSRKRESQKLFNYRMRFEKEAEKIGGVNYTFGDSIA